MDNETFSIGDTVRIVNGYNPQYSNHTPRVGQLGTIIAINESAKGYCYTVAFEPVIYVGILTLQLRTYIPVLNFFETELRTE